MRAPFAILAVGLAVAPTLAAQAQQTQPAPGTAAGMPPALAQLTAYATSETYKKDVAGAVRASEQLLGMDCKDIKPVERSEFTMFQAPVFSPDQPHPVSGAWKDQVRIERCGKPAFHNILLVAQPGGPPKLGFMVPGLTGTTPALQQMTVAAIGKAAAEADAKCDKTTLRVIDTRRDQIVEPPRLDAKGLTIAGKISEVWVARYCGKVTEYPVEFTSDGKGGWTVVLTKAGKKKK